ncbi:MAG: glycosyltransferase [Thermodesulfobacteriota bacterium]
MAAMKVSLIVTVKDAESTIGAFLDSVASQSRKPDEVIVADLGSADRTRALVESHPLGARLETVQGNNAEGLNRAISLASGEVMAVSAADCVLDHDWLEMISGLQGADIVAGACSPMIESLFDACQYSVRVFSRPGSKGGGVELSNRSLAFRKVVWEELGGFPEWLDASEDSWFHDMMRQSRFIIRQEPRAVANWRMKPGLKNIYLDFHASTQGDGRALQRTKSHMARLIGYAAGVEMLLMSFWRAGWLLALALGFGAYLWQPVRVFRRLGAYPLTARAVAEMARILVVSDAGKILGYLAGLKNAHEAPPVKPR